MFNRSTIKVNKKRYPIKSKLTIEHFRSEYQIITELLNNWIIMENKVVPEELNVVDTVLHNLATFNLKSINEPGGQQQLTKLIVGVPNQLLINRFDNFLILVYLSVDKDVINICKGRFYHTLKQEFGVTSAILNWLDKTHNNLWILPIIQHTYQRLFVS